MTLQEIQTEVQRIRDCANDDESAHSMEDKLRARFILFVSQTADGELAEMARAVLSTDDIEFCRWCA